MPETEDINITTVADVTVIIATARDLIISTLKGGPRNGNQITTIKIYSH